MPSWVPSESGSRAHDGGRWVVGARAAGTAAAAVRSVRGRAAGRVRRSGGCTPGAAQSGGSQGPQRTPLKAGWSVGNMVHFEKPSIIAGGWLEEPGAALKKETHPTHVAPWVAGRAGAHTAPDSRIGPWWLLGRRPPRCCHVASCYCLCDVSYVVCMRRTTAPMHWTQVAQRSLRRPLGPPGGCWVIWGASDGLTGRHWALGRLRDDKRETSVGGSWEESG